MRKKKIALVNHRYGAEVIGGSENLCRLLAHKLQSVFEVEVLTTCALDYMTWANFYPEGWQMVEGISVCRFPSVKERDKEKTDNLVGYIDGSIPHGMSDEIGWIIDQGPYVPDLHNFLHDNYGSYDAIIFMTYLYYTSAICSLGLPNAILMPTAHDELPLRLPYYEQLFSSVQGYIYLTPEEKELVEGRFPTAINKPCMVGCFGLEIDNNLEENVKKHEENPYIIYAGRITTAKNCEEMISFFCRYKDEHPSSLRLILIGEIIDTSIPTRHDVVYLGFVNEKRKKKLLREAIYLVIPSKYESLSIVALEAMAEDTPILVNSACAVLHGHVRRSEAGFAYQDYEDFARCLDEALSNTLAYNKRRVGRAYIQKYYSWDKVAVNLSCLVEQVGFQRKIDIAKTNNIFEHTYYGRILLPAHSGRGIPLVMLTDDNYVPILAVALQSVLDVAAPDSLYDVVVLSDGISSWHKRQLLEMVANRSGVTLRFYELKGYMDANPNQLHNPRYSRATFMRLQIPRIFSEYKRVIYLDDDLIVRHDLADLYATDMQGMVIGAVRDPVMKFMLKDSSFIHDYLLRNLRLHRAEDYFNAGVMLIDLEAMRSLGHIDELLYELGRRKWLVEDQDVLNYAVRGYVYWLDYRWNVFISGNGQAMCMIDSDTDYHTSAEDPYIIHYSGGQMPLRSGRVWHAHEFWQMARQTPFYEEILMMLKE